MASRQKWFVEVDDRTSSSEMVNGLKASLSERLLKFCFTSVHFWAAAHTSCLCCAYRSSRFMSWAPALLSSHLCQPVKRLDDELKPGARPPPRLSAVLKRAMDGRNGRERDRDMGGKGINHPLTKSSLLCLLSNGWVKPNWDASLNHRKGQVNKCMFVWPDRVSEAEGEVEGEEGVNMRRSAGAGTLLSKPSITV